jgi:aspartyl-tRNA(Asn)/glutamyl-tRNA(Gln) amidotransferase subunit B
MLPKVSKALQPIIGLEIHARLATKTKLFSRAPNNVNSPPNTNVALFDVGVPGTLPVQRI